MSADNPGSGDRPGDDDPGRGRRLGLDVGTVRIGVSLSDPDGILATPLETVAAEKGSGQRPGSEIDRVLELIAENFVVEVIVGLPVSMRSRRTASTARAQNYAAELRRRLDGVPVRMVDERMSTVAATSAMRASGVSERKGRSRIDQAAAVHILQGWLDARKAHRRVSEQWDTPSSCDNDDE